MSDDVERLHALRDRRLKLQRIKELEGLKSNLREQLPHLYGFPWYGWAKKFFDSRNRMNLLCAANQISKSSTMIRKAIHWATDVDMWPKLWASRPRQFWYIYPSQDVAAIEFDKKWVPEFMPRGPMKLHPTYGWKEVRDTKGVVKRVDFNSGVSIMFKAHTQKIANLQTATVDAVFADEELPAEMYDEIAFRLARTRGYFHMVFTATMGQELWRCAIQPANKDEEKFPDAFKQRISMYDCLEYVGSTEQTPWTKELIEKEVIPKCKNEFEVRRRVYGEFVKDVGKSYYGFSPDENICAPILQPKRDWTIYAGVDPGSGGTAHPASIVFVGVEPGNQRGYVFRGWRGDGIETTAGDVFEKYQQMSSDLTVVDKRYDYSAKDFWTIASRAGVSFTRADKSREMGANLLNTLFRNGMLMIAGCDPELAKLVTELMTLDQKTDKAKARDDLIDAMRYAVVSIPWDWEKLNSVPGESEEVEYKPKQLTEQEILADEIKRRRGAFVDGREKSSDASWADELAEIEYWNNQYG